MHERPGFIFATCQVGAEGAVKQEVVREWPDFRLAFSRPGFLTFKLPEDHGLLADFDLRSVFARSYGFSLGRVRCEHTDEAARRVWELHDKRPVRHLHVWRRGTGPAGERDDVSLLAAAKDPRDAIRWACPSPEALVPQVASVTG
jgi:23S rRNA (cytidine2498-2'-O)-methyltransferase